MFLRTTSEIIDHVGGNATFRQWYLASLKKGPQPGSKAVSQWRRIGFPARTFDLMTTRLRTDFNIEGPPELWGQDQ